jgi:hypothetical protein
VITARPWGITGLTRLDDGNYQFTAVLLTSMGPVYIRGCRYMAATTHRVLMPCVRAGAHYYPQVVIDSHMRTCLHRLLDKGIAKQVADEMVRESRRRDANA